MIILSKCSYFRYNFEFVLHLNLSERVNMIILSKCLYFRYNFEFVLHFDVTWDVTTYFKNYFLYNNGFQCSPSINPP